MKFFLLLFLLCSVSFFSEEMSTQDFTPSSKSKMFSLSSEEMLFASKLSDLNRRHFCYKFSFKERALAMMGDEDHLTPDECVEKVFSSFYGQVK